jgi:hypothetical protein
MSALFLAQYTNMYSVKETILSVPQQTNSPEIPQIANSPASLGTLIENLKEKRRVLREKLLRAKAINDNESIEEYQREIKSISDFIAKESDRITREEIDDKLEEEIEKKKQVQLQSAVENLPKADFFHTVPVYIEADKPFMIQAGVVDPGEIDAGKIDPKTLEKIKKDVLKKLNIKENPEIVKDIPYQRLGIDIKLDVDKDFFKVRDIKTGIKPIVSGFPESWVWELRPIKAGKSNINLKVVIDLKVSGVEGKPERIIFQEEREIHRNLKYSISQFISSNWANISTLTVGSGSLALVISNWQKKREEKQKPRRQAGFAPGDTTSQKSSKK